jgi:hypothetical protein
MALLLGYTCSSLEGRLFCNFEWSEVSNWEASAAVGVMDR